MGGTSYVSGQAFMDFTGDGRPDLVFTQNGQLMIARNDPAPGGATNLRAPVAFTDSTFTGHAVSASSSTIARFGAATADSTNQDFVWRQAIDMNGDGRVDIVDAAEVPGKWIVYLNKPSTGPSGIQWVRRAFDVTRLRNQLQTAGFAVPQNYLPLSERRTGTDYDKQVCWLWTTNGYVEGWQGNSRCGADTGAISNPQPEQTYTEWELTDINGDGYPDFVFAESPATVVGPPKPSDGSGSSLTVTGTYHFKIAGSSTIDVAYNVAGLAMHPETSASDPFSATSFLYAGTGCGLERWSAATFDLTTVYAGMKGQKLDCTFVDVNGDGLLDRVEDDPSPASPAYQQLVTLGTGSGFGITTMTLPFYVSSQISGYADHCPPNAPHPALAFTSTQLSGLRDLTGDGIPDFIAPLVGPEVFIGTGTQLVASPPSVAAGALSFEDENCDGTGSFTSKGFFDIDGDGKLDWLSLPSTRDSLQVSAIVNSDGAGAPSAGRIVSMDNGAGALTLISYRSAKEDMTTPHQVPFPEIVVDHTQTTDLHQLGGRVAKKTYAFGNISMFYDSPAGMFRPTGYLRTVSVTTTASPTTSPTAPISNPRVEGSAEIVDRLPFDPNIPTTDNARFLRYAQTGRVSDVTVLAVAAGTDPWSLLSDVLPSDLRRAAGSHQDADGKMFAEPGDYVATDCFDLSDPFDFETSAANNYGTNYRPCYSHGFVYTKASEAWHGNSAPPMSGNVETRSSVLSVDDLGRPTRIFDEQDTHRADDNICIDTVYAAPASAALHPPWSIASRTISACDKTGTATFEVDSFNYDHLAPGSVSDGLVTTRSTHSYTTDVGADTGIISYDINYDAVANPTFTTMHRADGATRSRTVTYDEFGLVGVHVSMQGTNVATQDEYNTVDPVSEEILTATDANKTERGTTFDGFGRPLSETFLPPGGKVGVLSAWSYAGFDAPDASGRRVDVTTFQEPVDPTQVKTAPGHHASTYLDELARPRQTAIALGDDYANDTLITGSRAYDELGRVVFEADPYPASQAAATAYGTTRFYNRDNSLDVTIRGRGRQAYSRTVDDSVERYPTLYAHSFDNNQETTTTVSADALVSSSPQANVQHQQVKTATGHVITRSTWQNGTRLEYEQLSYDPLGQLTTLMRFQDAATPANAVATQWQLDSQGRVITLTDPSSAPQKRTYDNWGELTQIESQASPARDITYTYDAFGRLLHTEEQTGGVVDPSTKSDYGYDTARVSPITDNANTVGRLSYAVGPTQEIRYGYDAFGQQTAVTHLDANGSVYVEQSGHHADGSQAWLEVDLPDASYKPERMDYEYDTAGRLRWMWYSDGNNTQEILNVGTLDAWGRTRDAKLGVVSYSASFADTGRRLPKSVKVTGATESRAFSYDTVDAVGRQLTRTYDSPEFSGTETASYDALGRLQTRNRTHQTTSTQQWSFSYDPLGNVTKLADQIGSADATLSYATSGDLDRICRIGYGDHFFWGRSCNVQYDSSGNVVSEPTRIGSTALSYYASGGVHTIMSSSGVAATFSYDPFGQLDVLNIEQSGALLREDRHYGSLITKRTQIGTTSTADYVSRQFPGAGFVVSRRGKGAKWIYEVSEAKGVRFTADDTGNFVQDTDYNAYGEASSQGALPGTTGYSTDQWNGGDALDGLGLVLVGARVYDPVIGRFLSRDPLLIPRSSSTTNPYAFGFGDPINVSDRTGMDSVINGGSLYYGSYNVDSGPSDSYIDPLGILFSGAAYVFGDPGPSGPPGPPPVYVNFTGGPDFSVSSGGGLALAVQSNWTSAMGQITHGGRTFAVDIGWLPPPPPPPPPSEDMHYWVFGNPTLGLIAINVLADLALQELLPEVLALDASFVADEAPEMAEAADAAAASNGVRVASGMGGGAEPATVVRVIQRGEKIADIIEEAKTLTYTTGNEHALVTLTTGERVLVSGGETGIDLSDLPIRRILGHTHPYQFAPTGPSAADFSALEQLGQRSSYLLEHGELSRFSLGDL